MEHAAQAGAAAEPGAQTAPDAAIQAALHYESLLVPGLFATWPRRLLSAADYRPDQRLLDVACGTGIVARGARAIGAEDTEHATIAGLDIDPGMLAVAERLAPSVEWRQGSAESLPFGDQSFDVVTIQFGLMFFEHRSKALAEALRVLRPGGRLALSVWNDLKSMPAYSIQVELLQRLAGQAAADALRAPFCMGNRKALTALVEEAGFELILADTLTALADFPGIRDLVESELTGWLPVMGVNLDDETMQSVLDEAARALAAYRTEHGRMVYDTAAHVVSARKPT